MSVRLAYVALGSNLGDRHRHLRGAVASLGATVGLRVVRCSSLYETAPVGPAGQGPYLNAVVALESELAPRKLLERLWDIERASGRVRSGVHGEARTLDLDLLFYGSARIFEPDLRVPHPRLHERPFVLAPLREIAPTLRHPVLGRSIAELAVGLGASRAWSPETVRKLDERGSF